MVLFVSLVHPPTTPSRPLSVIIEPRTTNHFPPPLFTYLYLYKTFISIVLNDHLTYLPLPFFVVPITEDLFNKLYKQQHPYCPSEVDSVILDTVWYPFHWCNCLQMLLRLIIYLSSK